MKFNDITEIVAGLVLNKRINAHSITPDILMEPYDRMVAMLRDGKEMTDLIDTIGMAPIIAADEASKRVDNKLPADWLALLEKSAARNEAAGAFQKASKQLSQGEDIDVGRVTTALEKVSKSKLRFTKASDVLDTDIPWRRTYYAPFDKHFGNVDPSKGSGFPEASLVIIGGPPGTGKTSLMVKIIGESAKAGKTCAVFTLEMTNAQITRRLIEASDLTLEERENVLLCDDQLDSEEVYAYGCQLASLHDLHFIAVDFADLLVTGDEDDAKVGKVYRTMAKLAKITRVPVILLSQLNREYVGGIPRITNLRYSGLAEAMGALILLLYNPKQIWAKMGSDDRLAIHEGKGYVIAGKSRYGFREGGVGAIEIGWDGLHAWSDESFGWHDLGS